MSIGIDCGGSKIAVVTVTDEQVTDFGVWEADPDAHRGVQLYEMGKHLTHRWYTKSRLHDVWVEAPLVAGVKNLQSSLKVAQSTGVVQAALYNVRQVAVSSWKKHTVGSGNADKNGVREWVQENHPQVYALLGHSQDLIDAYCIARYGEVIASTLTPPTHTGDEIVYRKMQDYQPQWHDRAACAGMDDFVFFGSSDPNERPAYTLTDIAKAREVCRSCPVLEQCLRAAIENREEYGVWAGTTVNQRKDIRAMMSSQPEISLDRVISEYSKKFRGTTMKRSRSSSTTSA